MKHAERPYSILNLPQSFSRLTQFTLVSFILLHGISFLKACNLYITEVYLGPCQTSMMEPFGVKAIVTLFRYEKCGLIST